MAIRMLVLLLLALLAGSVAAQSLRITEVDPATGQVELHNSGEEAVDAADLWLCNRPDYARIGDLEVISGDLNVPPGGLLVVSWASVAASDAELGLYASNSFGSAEALLDYLQWGAAGHGREGVAAEAGLWPAGAFLEAPAEGQTLSYQAPAEGEDGEMAPDQRWLASDASLGEANPASP